MKQKNVILCQKWVGNDRGAEIIFGWAVGGKWWEEGGLGMGREMNR